MKETMGYWAAMVAVCAMGASASAADKNRYTLFHPTPRELMREMATDRPDTTESPKTVDAGHFQVELSLIEWTHDEAGGVQIDEIVVMPSNIKVGLLNNVDLQLVVDPYVNQRVGASRREGFGDIQVRAKVNLWGNEGGKTSMAVMPFVKFPTASEDLGNDDVEGGIIFPLSFELPEGFSLATMAEIDILRDDEDEGYGWGVLHTVSLSRDIAGDLGGFVEYIGFAPVDLGIGYQAAVGAGLTYGLGPDVQLDAAVTVGISDSAEDFNLRVGVSFRI